MLYQTLQYPLREVYLIVRIAEAHTQLLQEDRGASDNRIMGLTQYSFLQQKSNSFRKEY
jgi:hypothetical protein